MLGTEESHQRHTGSTQPCRVADSFRIHTGLIRHQTDSTAAYQMQAVAQQDRDAGAHPVRCATGSGCSGAAQT
jgi:hypothetical protein